MKLTKPHAFSVAGRGSAVLFLAVILAAWAPDAYAQSTPSGLLPTATLKPQVGVTTSQSELYRAAVLSDARVSAMVPAGEPLAITGSGAAKITADGQQTIWYQVESPLYGPGWIPGSRLAFTSTAFGRELFDTADQYTRYLAMAARTGEPVIAVRSYEKVAKGDTGYLVAIHEGELPLAVVWSKDLEATPAEEYLPEGFPAGLQSHVYFVDLAVVEMTGSPTATALADLVVKLGDSDPYDGHYAEITDESIPWFMPPDTSYASATSGGYEDYSYDEAEGYDDSGDYDEDGAAIESPGGIESYGKIAIGSTVILGRHDDANGDSNWADDMEAYVGTKAVVTELAGTDGADMLVVRVDTNGYVWRVRNLALDGAGTEGSYGYQTGDKVIVGAHRPISGDSNWAGEMSGYVGQVATITELAGTDGTGSTVVHLDIDDGSWYWRAETLTPAE